MLKGTYKAKDEFELYGALARELSGEDFSENAVKALCFYQAADSSWVVLDAIETTVEDVCEDFVYKYRPKNFVVTLDATKPVYEVCFQGPKIFLFSKFDGHYLSVLEFEDKKPNEEFKVFEKKELKDSVAFLKKILNEG